MSPKAALLSKAYLTKSQLEAIGCVAAESAYLERMVEGLITDFSGISSETPQVSLAREMIGGKLIILKNLGIQKIQSEEKRGDFCKLMDEVMHANYERVSVIHGCWLSRKEDISKLMTSELLVGTAEVPPKRKIPAISATEIWRIAESLSNAYWKLYGLRLDSASIPKEIPDKWI